jgi:hypothetical protein
MTTNGGVQLNYRCDSACQLIHSLAFSLAPSSHLGFVVVVVSLRSMEPLTAVRFSHKRIFLNPSTQHSFTHFVDACCKNSSAVLCLADWCCRGFVTRRRCAALVVHVRYFRHRHQLAGRTPNYLPLQLEAVST